MKKRLVSLVCFSFLLVFIVWATDKNGTVDLKWVSLNAQMPFWYFCALFLLIVLILLCLCRAIEILIKKQTDESLKKVRETQSKIKMKKDDVDEAMFALLKTMTATTEGDMKTARKNLKILETKIGHNTIIDVLELKIAKGEKDFDAVEKLSSKLMKNKDSELVGLKALVETSSKKKDFQKALESANRAFNTRRDLYWVIENTFNLRALASDWKGACEVLDVGKNKKMLAPEKYDLMKAVALFEMAMQEKKNDLAFLRYLMQAHELQPSFEPAAIELAKFYEKENQPRKAEKILKNIWRLSPTYEVAKAYLKLFKEDSAIESVQRMESLALLNSKEFSLNNLILAELDMKAKFWDKAKSELEMFLINNPATKKIAKMMSQYEKTVNKNEASASDWARREKECAEECLWVCSHCGEQSAKWKPFCAKCGSFNPFEWFLCLKEKNKK